MFGCTKDREINIPPIMVDGDRTVLAYWHFNNVQQEDLLLPAIQINTSFLTYLSASGVLNYCSGANQSCFDTASDFTELNLLEGFQAGTVLRLRNPGDALLLSIDTKEYANIRLDYAVRRTGSGAKLNEIFYSVDGTNFLNSGLSDFSFVVEEDWRLISVDFSNIPSVNNNENLRIKIDFTDGNNNDSGNNRIDNLLITGQKIN